MKLKLTDSPGIAGGFYWIYQKKDKSFRIYPFLYPLYQNLFTNSKLVSGEVDLSLRRTYLVYITMYILN